MLVIVDIDGTLALRAGREPFQWDLLMTDTPNEPVVCLVRAMSLAGHEVVFLSGRHERLREATERWLDENVGVPGDLLMRQNDDTRPDFEVKSDLFRSNLRLRSDFFLVLDDRYQVVQMWRNLYGLCCLQVADGDF